MRIIIIGAGKIAWNFAKRFKEKHIIVTQLYNRTIVYAERFERELGISITSKMEEIRKDADVYILAVSDAAIPVVAAQLSKCDIKGLVVHTSGATPGAILQPFFEQSGVFYPLQSFSSEIMPQWSNIPICIDAAKETDLHILQKLAKKIGKNVYPISDEQRAVLHIAAVFANNFTNHLLLVAEQILLAGNIDGEILQPLIAETFRKAQMISPQQAQTGPASRKDTDTIQKHLYWLKAHPDWEAIYKTMTEAIIKERENDNLSFSHS
jgi:predicted short-subunit dehydrogenase-like oxidoreductase (DUF2520 family)